MNIYNTVLTLQEFIQAAKKANKSIGFVPTMGALHKGHMSLIEKARNDNNLVVSSIYVNPLQFNNKSDFTLYPRTFEKDIQMLKNVGCDAVFCPDDTIINSGEDFDYDIGFMDTVMEGLHRPGHFKGVAYIVKTLFEAVEPDSAYFGEKDYQQLAVIKKMTKDFNLNINIISCETIREENGLAMSSRNERLSAASRGEAGVIYAGLKHIKKHIDSLTPETAKKFFEEKISDNDGFSLEYIEICNAETLKPISSWRECDTCVVCTAVFLENIRLIDNIILF